MKSLASAFALLTLLVPIIHAQSPDALSLKAEQIPPDCKSIDGDYPADLQTAILWKKTDLYQGIMPDPIAKNAQTFDCKNEKGTVYVFQFADAAARQQAASFLKPLLWGEPHPTADHPELILENANRLSIVSFRKTPKTLLAALQATTPAAAAASDSAGTEFAIPGHGKLRLTLPANWQAKSRPLADPPSVILHFGPPSGDAFDIQVTAVWLDAAKLAKESPELIRKQVQHTGDGDLPHAVEKSLVVKDFHGPQSYGSYFSLTDNDPGPSYPYLTQGIFLAGPVLAPFTILTRAANSPELALALQSFTSATYTDQ